jgi:hypothetical protein
MPKCSGGDQSFSLKELHLIRISVHPLDLCITQVRVLLVVLIFIVDVIIILLLLRLLLSSCILGCLALRIYQHDHKRLLLL